MGEGRTRILSGSARGGGVEAPNVLRTYACCRTRLSSGLEVVNDFRFPYYLDRSHLLVVMWMTATVRSR